MSIKIKETPRFRVLNVDQKTTDPVDEVLAMLKGEENPAGRYMLDFSSLKPGRIREGLPKLFQDLPYKGDCFYSIAVPDAMVQEMTEKARCPHTGLAAYVHSATYQVVNKTGAQAILNQR